MTGLRLIEYRSTDVGTLVPVTATPSGLQCERRTSGMIEVRADGSDGPDFWGPALPWMTLDSYATRFAPDAFRDGGVDSEPYAFLWMHDPWTVTGSLRAEARDNHLWIEGFYDDTDEGNRAKARAKSGSARGLSVGFERLQDEPQEDGTVTITKARLVEVSQITARMESVPGAGLSGVRARAADPVPPVEPPTVDAGLAARLRLAYPGE